KNTKPVVHLLAELRHRPDRKQVIHSPRAADWATSLADCLDHRAAPRHRRFPPDPVADLAIFSAADWAQSSAARPREPFSTAASTTCCGAFSKMVLPITPIVG